MKKTRIIIETTPEIKAKLQDKAKGENLSLKDYLILKGLNRLKGGE